RQHQAFHQLGRELGDRLVVDQDAHCGLSPSPFCGVHCSLAPVRKGRERMPTIDVQVHCYERNHPGRPWHAVLAGPPEVTGDDMIKAMNSVGVDGALLISVYTMYRWDASYAVGVRKAHPDKFALIKPVDPNDPKVADTIADWAKMDGAVAVRIMMNDEVS